MKEPAVMQQIFATCALLSALLIFRLKDLLELFQSISALRRLGAVDVMTSRMRKLRTQVVLELCLWIVLSFMMVDFVTKVCRIWEYVSSTANSYDPVFTQFEVANVRTLQSDAYRIAIAVLILVLLEYILSSIRRARVQAIDVPALPHPFRLPRRRGDTVVGSWYERLSLSFNQDGIESELRSKMEKVVSEGLIHSDWKMWAIAVSTYSRARKQLVTNQDDWSSDA